MHFSRLAALALARSNYILEFSAAMLDWRALFVNLIMKKITPIVDIRGRAKSFSGMNLVALAGDDSTDNPKYLPVRFLVQLHGLPRSRFLT